MNAFLSTLKGKIIAGAATAGTIGAVVVAAVLLTSGYRTIAIEAMNGVTNITNGGNVSEAYVGQHLKAQDDVRVAPASDLTLQLDNDKYVFAEENTHFWIEAVGKIGDTRTKIFMDEGSTLNRIDNKLAAGEYYQVDTPNSTMSVRGTVFRVTCRKDSNGDTITIVEVFEGEVFVQVKLHDGTETDENQIVAASQSVVIRSNEGFSELVKDVDGSIVREIDYHSIPQNTAKFMGRSIDAGRVLSITKDLLFDYTAINEHQFSEIHDEISGEIKEVCEICGMEIQHEEIDGEEHRFEEKEETAEHCDEEGRRLKVCVDCGLEAEVEIIPAGEHQFGEWKIVIPATCIKEGMKARYCEKCDTRTEEIIKPLGHKFGELIYVPAANDTPAKYIKICERCGEIENILIPGDGGNNQGDLPGLIQAGEAAVTVPTGNDSADDSAGGKKKKHSGNKENGSGSSSKASSSDSTNAGSGNENASSSNAPSSESTASSSAADTSANSSSSSKSSSSSSSGTTSSSSSKSSSSSSSGTTSSSSSKSSSSSSSGTTSSSSSKSSSSSSSGTTSSSSSKSSSSSSSGTTSSSSSKSSSSSSDNPCAAGHTWVETVVNEATCAATGLAVNKCSVCGTEGQTRVIEKKDHTMVQDSQTPATCQTEGRINYICSVCKEEGTPDILQKTDHDYSGACTPAAGARYKHFIECSYGCGEKKEEDCSMSYTGESDQGGHKMKCSECNEEWYESHNYERDATGMAVCTTCGDVLVE